MTPIEKITIITGYIVWISIGIFVIGTLVRNVENYLDRRYNDKE